MEWRRRSSAIGVVATLSILAALGSGSVPDLPDDWRTLVRSSNPPDWQRGANVLLAERKAAIAELIALAAAPPTEAELGRDSPYPVSHFYDYDTRRNIAVRLLGELRAEEAVPDLVELMQIEGAPGKQVVLRMPALTPAGLALARIGQPAVPALLHLLRERGVPPERKILYEGREVRVADRGKRGSGMHIGHEILRILVVVQGVDATIVRVERMAAREDDAAARARLTDAVRHLETWRLRYEKLERR